MADVSHQLVYDLLDGECKKFETLWAISSALRLNWKYLFDFDLKQSQFHRAVLSGDSESGR